MLESALLYLLTGCVLGYMLRRIIKLSKADSEME